MFKSSSLIRILVVLFLGVFPLEASVSIENAPIIKTRLPATENSEIEENITFQFNTTEDLRQALNFPISIDPVALNKIINKLASNLSQTIYPSQLAKAIFEVAFLDPKALCLTSKERTDNVGYVLSNLGSGHPEVVKTLYAFYYGYSFEYFARGI